eukprot:5796969-Prymnesium_polylepis.2
MSSFAKRTKEATQRPCTPDARARPRSASDQNGISRSAVSSACANCSSCGRCTLAGPRWWMAAAFTMVAMTKTIIA